MSLTDKDKALRLTGIGGSDIGAICGLANFKKPIDVWLDKRGKGTDTSSLPAKCGIALEPVAAGEYELRHDCKLAGPFASHRTDVAPWHIISVDRLELLTPDPFPAPEFGALPARDTIARLVEIKTTNWFGGRAFGVDGSDDLPLSHLAQVQWYLAGLGVDHAIVAVIINTSDYREFHVERDTELQGYLLERGEAFWQLVQKGVEPEADGSDSFKRYLQTRYKRTVDIMVPPSPDIDAITLDLRRATALKKAIDKQVKKLAQVIQHRIGEAEGVETAEGACTFKFDRTGRIPYKDLVTDLLLRNRMTADEADEYIESFRNDPPRRFLTPQKWRKDEIGRPIPELLEMGMEGR